MLLYDDLSIISRLLSCAVGSGLICTIEWAISFVSKFACRDATLSELPFSPSACHTFPSIPPQPVPCAFSTPSQPLLLHWVRCLAHFHLLLRWLELSYLVLLLHHLAITTHSTISNCLGFLDNPTQLYNLPSWFLWFLVWNLVQSVLSSCHFSQLIREKWLRKEKNVLRRDIKKRIIILKEKHNVSWSITSNSTITIKVGIQKMRTQAWIWKQKGMHAQD